MSERTAVYLITGFLGSGKTTFLKRLVAAFPGDRRLVVLMNEFGDVGVDGPVVATDDVALLEISRGSIFCACVKSDFIRALMDISQRVQPDALIIEATGIADPSDLKRDLQLSIFDNRFQFKEQFCIIDAQSFADVYDTFASVEKQIQTSTVFIVNKVDQVNDETLGQVEAMVAVHQPDACLHKAAYADIALTPYLPDAAVRKRPAVSTAPPVSPETRDALVDSLIADPAAAVMPPDALASAVYRWCGTGREAFDRMTAMIPAGIVRAKGFFQADGATALFSYVMGDTQITPVAAHPRLAGRINRIVFIGSPASLAAVSRIACDALRPDSNLTHIRP